MSRRLLIVSPCRDEAQFIERTIESLAQQTVVPTKWLIVDDGSTDETPAILAKAAARHDFIQVIRRDDRGSRSVGPGVIDAFYFGLSHVDLSDYDYLCKLDCDLELESRYFERAMEYFEDDPWLGNLSGKLELRVDGRTAKERIGDENAVGAAKLYRIACFEDIGGFVRGVCWDGIDGHMCRMKGWVAASVDDPELTIGHLRQMGSSHKGIWHGRMRWGHGKYFMGSALPYVAAVALYRSAEKPYLIGGLGIFAGYLRSLLTKAERMSDERYLSELRGFEMASLLRGRKRTLQRINARIRSGRAPGASPEATAARSTPVSD